MKKLIHVLPIACFTSTIANANLTPTPSVITFSDVALGTSITVPLDIVNTGSLPVEGISVSMSGNSTEFHFNQCPSTLYQAQTCKINLTFTPQHYGTKKKLNIDGIEVLNDGSVNKVSITIPVLGNSDNPNKP